jgi:hypothetical protein
MDEHSRIVRAGSVMLRGVRRPDPAKGRPDALRFVRDIQLRVMALWPPIFVALIAVAAPTWVLLAAAAAMVLGLADLIYLTVQARR